MKFLTICAVLLAGVLASPSKKLKPRILSVPAGRPDGRIFEGQKALDWEFPYQAALLLEMRTYDKECGGSVIGNRWILTAAHCARGARSGTVYLGGTTYYNAIVQHSISKKNIIIHPQYKRKTLENDIALIEIPFTGFDVNIQRVDLPALATANETFVGKEVAVSGWGRYKVNSSDSAPSLLWGNMTVISNAACAKKFKFKIYPSDICTASTKGVNICGGDSGGPVVFGPNHPRIQVGIVSSGATKCRLPLPAIHTRVSSYLEWIKEKTGIYY